MRPKHFGEGHFGQQKKWETGSGFNDLILRWDSEDFGESNLNRASLLMTWFPTEVTDTSRRMLRQQCNISGSRRLISTPD